eukprot:5825242-Prymnesium_polylepis.1
MRADFGLQYARKRACVHAAGSSARRAVWLPARLFVWRMSSLRSSLMICSFGARSGVGGRARHPRRAGPLGRDHRPEAQAAVPLAEQLGLRLE